MLDSFGVLVLVAAGWMSIGVLLAVFMGRRGHNSFGWFVLGAVLGPLAAVLAVDARRHDEELAGRPVRIGEPAAPGRGPVDVLVGYDHSPESAAAVETVVHLFGERLGRLTVATVVPYGGLKEQEQAATDGLRRLSLRLPRPGPALEILHGHPSTALKQYAVEAGYELIAVGTRGAGISKAILGSAASELASDAKVPVLLVGGRGAGGAAEGF